MRILRLQASGFKRLVAVDISPEGGLVEVRGNNAEGKTSVLDAVMSALGGAAVQPVKPVRTGEEYAIIRVEAGKGETADLVVTRTFDEKGDRLRVENGEGAVFEKGQTMLDRIVGAIAFDPLAFAKMKAGDQAAELRRLVPLSVDLDALAAADKADTLARRDVNRDAKAIKPRIDAIVLPNVLPERPDRAAIVAALGSAGETNSAIERERYRRADVEGVIELDRGSWSHSLERVTALRAEADRLEAAAKETDADLKRREAERDALPPLDEPLDTAKLSADLDAADRVLRVLSAADNRAALEREFDALRVKSEALSTAIADRAKARADALASAEMPIPGLSFAALKDVVPAEESDELIVTLDGEPFSQASGAQQLRASMGLAMAANPKLRVMLIRDGSLLDKKGLEVVRELATERDYQVWLEAVGDDGAGIIMEGGRVRGADEPEKLPAPKRRKAKGEGEPERASKPADNAVTDGLDDRETVTFTPPADKPKARPRAMREFSTSPVGGLFGEDTK